MGVEVIGSLVDCGLCMVKCWFPGFEGSVMIGYHSS